MHKGCSLAILLEITTPKLLQNHPASAMPATHYKSNIQNSKINSNDMFSVGKREILNTVFFSAEGLFKKAGIQTAKIRHWSSKNPHIVHAVPLHNSETILWCWHAKSKGT
jgi:hypothetical protein